MYVAFILKGKYLMAVQRKTKSFKESRFQAVLWEVKDVKQQIDNIQNLKNQHREMTLSMDDQLASTNKQTFDLLFSEIHQVYMSDDQKLTVVGRTKNDMEVIQQYHFSAKANIAGGCCRNKIRMKNEFVVSLTTRRMVIKKKVCLPILQGVEIGDTAHATVSALSCEGKRTCFVYLVTSFEHENRWVVCVYNGQERKAANQFQYLELKPNIIRGAITSACFLKNESKLVVITTAFQLLTFDIQKDGLVLRNIRLLSDESLLLDTQQEDIYLQKLNYKCLDTDVDKELIIACSTSGRLFFVPESLNSFNTKIHSLDVSSTGVDAHSDGGDGRLYVEQFTSCDFTKQCILTCRSGKVYTLDIFKKTVVQKTNINTGSACGGEIGGSFSCDMETGFYYQLIDLNWFGDELYHLQDNKLHVHLIKPSQTTLKELCKAKILENLPVEDIVRSTNIPKYVKRIVT